MIPSRREADLYRSKVIHIKHLYNDFIIMKVKELMNKMIVDKIINRMQDKEVSDKIWINTVLKDDVKIMDDKIKVRITSEYFTEGGFDVAIGREYGTRDHFIAPRYKQALHWIQNGKSRFSLGHEVSGLPKLLIITKTIEEELPFLVIKLQEASDFYIKNIMRS